MRSGNYLYHMVPDDLVGDVLYPLNELERRFPAIAVKAAGKYAGREHIRQVRLPILDCLWNDVLHMTPLNPSAPKAALLACGFQPSPRRFFRISPDLLEPRLTVYFRHSKDTQGRYDFLASDFRVFDPESFEELDSIPQEQIAYFARMKAAGEPPLLWSRTPHVFHLGAIPTQTLPIIDW